jgi:hypothetical protein
MKQLLAAEGVFWGGRSHHGNIGNFEQSQPGLAVRPVSLYVAPAGFAICGSAIGMV